MIVKLLTVVTVAAEELVEAEEVGSSAEVAALGDENLLDEWVAVDDDAGRGAEGQSVDVPVDLGERREGLEGHFVATQKVQVAQYGPSPRTRRSRQSRRLAAPPSRG